MLKKIRNTLLSYIILLFYKIFKNMPWKFNTFMGRILALIFYSFDIKNKYVAFKNLKLVFRNITSKKIIEITKGCYINLGINLMEFFLLPRVKYFYRKIVNFQEKEKFKIKKLLSENKGLIFFTAHFSNWELLGCSLSLEKFPLAAIAREVYILPLNNIVNSIRRDTGEIVINRSKGNSVRDLFFAIKNKFIIGVLIDQNIRQLKNIKIPFLGVEANTPVSFAEVAIKYDIPAVVGVICRTAEGSYEVKIDPIDKVYYNNPNTLLTYVNSMLSKYIVEIPEQWVWIHKRW